MRVPAAEVLIPIDEATIEPDMFTVEEFFALIPDGQKADLIDGAIYVASPDTRRSDQVTGLIHTLMDAYAAARGLGRVFGSRFCYLLSKTRAPEPDVSFVSAERLSIVGERGGTAAPDIAVEVVCRDSRSRDYGEKKRLYEDAGVKEYWIVDPMRGRVEFLRLVDGCFSPVTLLNDRIFRSEALPGFWLDVQWLLEYPLPNSYLCLQQILAGPPASEKA